MEYNTQRKKMALPEYGRSVQNMVDHALTIEDRAERQRCANTIINIMGSMFPHLRDIPDFKHKLWDHLAIMSDFKLDIDYPFEIVKKEDMEIKPEKIAYPDGSIRYRHYGRFLEGMVKKAVDWEDEAEKKQLVNMLANQMKKSFCNWNKDGVEDQKIVYDLNEYSNGAINLQVEDLQLNSNQRYFNNQRRQQNNQRRQQNNNQRRKQH
ncbi:MAG: DUF4290 domain-containing protein [Bacteroidaceae bacterium]|nr:DUF4290 domain-containing protein [Bacteroidaceae bacterium]